MPQKNLESGLLRTILFILLVLLVVAMAAFSIYLSQYSSGNETALKLLVTPSN